MESRVDMSRKEGRLLGFLCQQAFIILATTEGVPLGMGIRRPSLTCDAEGRGKEGNEERERGREGGRKEGRQGGRQGGRERGKESLLSM